MTKKQAFEMANALRGLVWQPCCEVWLVVIPRCDGSATVIGPNGVSEYSSNADVRSGDALRHISFRSAYA